MSKSNITPLLESCLSDGSNAYSVGGIGALAEFQTDYPIVTKLNSNQFNVSSRLGSISLKICGQESALAYETLGSKKDTWQCGLLVSLPKELCNLTTHSVLTEMGEDRNAHLSVNKKHLLFDLGTGLPNMQFCVRTNNNDLISFLRSYEGQAIAIDGHPALDTILKASPHRVVMSQIARVEVLQKIDLHMTPSGPHTHLLPKLLKAKRLLASNIPVQTNHIPQLTIHPENPLFDKWGHRRDFKKAAYNKFLPILKKYGAPAFYAEKIRLRDALSSEVTPEKYLPPSSRLSQTAHKIELRQQIHLNGENTFLNDWRKKTTKQHG